VPFGVHKYHAIIRTVGYPLWIYLQVAFGRIRGGRPLQSLQLARSSSSIMALSFFVEGSINFYCSITRVPKSNHCVSDGSTDDTNRILKGYPEIKSIFLPKRHGKAAALNAAMRKATGEILVFVDIRPQIEGKAYRFLVSNFADPKSDALRVKLFCTTTT